MADDLRHRGAVAHPFTTIVRGVLVTIGLILIAAGITAIFSRESDTGAAALITLGVGLGLLALVGPFVDTFRYGGIEATFRAREAEQALDDAVTSMGASEPIDASDRTGALRRAEAHADLLGAARVLWIDDHPGGNDAERRILTSFGVAVDIAVSHDEALRKLHKRYDCVISDVSRPSGEPDGLAIVPAFLESPNRWLIFYVGLVKPDHGTPWGAMGITNRPDHLLHYVLDAVERQHFEDV